jgi:anti-sigma-K factor RskA
MPAPGLLARFRTARFWLPAAVAALLLLGFGRTIYNLRQQMAGLEARVQQLRAVAVDHERLLTLLTSPTVQIVTLTGTAHAPMAGARLLWETRRGAWTVLAQNLPTLPAGKAYQLWFLTAGTPIPAGTFQLDALRRGSIQAALPVGRSDITGAAVSLEPAGGVPQPTGPIVLAATF